MINAAMSGNGSEGVRKESFGENSMKQTTMKQQSNVNSNRHERSLSKTDTPDDAGNETKQTSKNRSSIDVLMFENGSEVEW
jgi:hypothetical protein